MKPSAIIGSVLVIIGIIIIGFIAIVMFGIFSHDFDNIRDIFTESNMIVFGIIFGIPFGICLLPGYYLLKSANKNP